MLVCKRRRNDAIRPKHRADKLADSAGLAAVAGLLQNDQPAELNSEHQRHGTDRGVTMSRKLSKLNLNLDPLSFNPKITVEEAAPMKMGSGRNSFS